MPTTSWRTTSARIARPIPDLPHFLSRASFPGSGPRTDERRGNPQQLARFVAGARLAADGGPLLVWEPASNVASHRSWPPTAVDLAAGRIFRFRGAGRPLSASWVGDAFYVAYTDPADQIRLVRVGADGTVGTVIKALPGVKARDLCLVSGATNLRVVYTQETVAADFTSTWKAYWQKVAGTGAALTDPIILPGPKNYPALGGAVAFDGDTVALLLATSGNPDNGFQAVRVGPSGAIVTPPVTVAQRPFALGGSADLARRGTEAVASWNTESGIRIARPHLSHRSFPPWCPANRGSTLELRGWVRLGWLLAVVLGLSSMLGGAEIASAQPAFGPGAAARQRHRAGPGGRPGWPPTAG